ncbi:MAG: hypothetical protein H6859_01675 [Rhodospirillales bacterium]|nr:hypothetical protein [Alphaproteobacteria bacterium]USO05939.1 MAG: hypothetical protein H6859_01675 [Rhodospirillales bacterium]
MTQTRRPWPEKRRKAQAENCLKNRPFNQATGPKTPEGKAAVSQNALKSGLYTADMQELRKLLRRQAAFIKTLHPPP